MLPTVPSTGHEWVVEALGCDQLSLTRPETLAAVFDAIVQDLKLNPVLPAQWHCFPAPGGVTGMLMLAESHLTVHTFPEYGAACFNLFCCTPRVEWSWSEKLGDLLGAEHVTVRELRRDYTRLSSAVK